MRAIDAQTGEKKWDFKMVNYTESGVLGATIGSGVRRDEGNFFALDARDGRCLWKVGLGGTVPAAPSLTPWMAINTLPLLPKAHSSPSPCPSNTYNKGQLFIS